jgi:Zn-finger nucleic acid-binding protein
VPLRAYGARLVCDDCTGILIRLDDLERAIAEMGAGAFAAVVAAEEAAAPCPTCTRPMNRYRLEVREHPNAFRGRYVSLFASDLVRAEAIGADTTFPGCPAHGLWFAQGLLAGVFARINHRLSVGRGGVRMGGERGLRISQRKPKPRAVAPYASPFAGRVLPCPHCRDPLDQYGDHWTCPRCSGAFVETPALEAMIAEMAHAPYELPAPAAAPGTRACPVCGEPTWAQALEGRTVERCPAHGVWFERGALSEVLARAAPATRPSWLRRWFRRGS